MSHPPKPDADVDTEHYLKTELLERIAHELRGPAGVTLGALDEIERLLARTETEEESRALISMARRGARRVLRTAERLTRTAQLEAGHAPMASVLLDVREIVARVRVELVTAAQPCVAHVDSSWLGAALGELFSQAIRCARSHVRIQVQADAGFVRISAEDDRANNVELPGARFLPLRDRRDCGLGWPMALDVARAHSGELAVSFRAEPANAGSTLAAVAVLSLKAA
jgi:signal transduction histidine kinase